MLPSGRTDQEPFISLHAISKRFGSLTANQDISLDLRQGEIHAIVGENGAGKSTLMKILNGHLQPDSGEIRLSGRRVAFRHPREAMLAGIGMAYQQSLIFPQLSALENVIVGFEPGGGGLINRKQAKAELVTLCRAVGFDLPLNAQASELAFAHRQQIEILRLLYRQVKVLILDEPTSLLSPPETEGFLRLLRSLQASGRTILFVSHRLQEVFAIADRVTVLSRGKAVGKYLKAEITVEDLVLLIMSGGKPDTSRIPSQPSSPPPDGNGPRVATTCEPPTWPAFGGNGSSVLLELRDVAAPAAPCDAGLENFSLNLQEGEVFGLGGVVGNGQRTLALLLSGLLPAERGVVALSGADITRIPIKERAARGLRWLPANPIEEALLPSRSIWENLLLGHQRQRPFEHYGWVKRRVINGWVEARLLCHEVVYGALTDPVSSLSGGNQQKVALSRVMEGAPRLIILEQPTRGLDIRAQERLRNQVRQLNADGTSFLVISYDLDELLALSHRVGILYRGRMVGIARSKDTSAESLGSWMLGVEARD
jgi:general nucleoside transport system ATP-binding protein